MSRIALVLTIAPLISLAAAQVADDPRECLLRYLHPLVEAGPDAGDIGLETLSAFADDCRVIGYVGGVTARVYNDGVTTHHDAGVIFWLDPASSLEDETRTYLAVGSVATWISGTSVTTGCIYSSPTVWHGIPTSEAVDHPMTDGSMWLALWTDPPTLMGIGAAFVDLELTERCPEPGGGWRTATVDHVPDWAWFATFEPVPVAPDLRVLSGSYTAPGASPTSWSTWDFHLEALD